MEIVMLLVGVGLGILIGWLLFRNRSSVAVDHLALQEEISALKMSAKVSEWEIANAREEKEKLAAEIRELRVSHEAAMQAERQQHLEKTELLREKFDAELGKERELRVSAEKRIEASIEKFKAQEDKLETLRTELDNVHKKYNTEFENIANKILDEKSAKFVEQNKSNLDIVLNPLRENLKRFEEQVEKTYKSESAERISLRTQIQSLVELNQKVSEEANNLARALKSDNKKQGSWGEVILEKVLERSGLTKGQEYKTQFSTSNIDGERIQPDAIIFLPDNKHVIVDAKVSLVSYEAFVNAQEDAERERCMRDHLTSVRSHVKLLSEKSYQSSPDLDTPDFVLLFVPIESSFSVAVQADQELFSYAWDRKIVIVSPSTLLATLRTIASIWKQERQTKNVMEIARQGGELYGKFVGFLEDMQKIEKGIENTSKAYQDALNKLSTGNGNIIKRIQNLKNLGAASSREKQIPARFLEDDAAALPEKDTL